MDKEHKDYQKIMQLLGHNDSQNVLLGIQLLKASMDAELIIKVLSGKSYITYLISFPLVTFFQDNPDIWTLVQPRIPNHIESGISKWMPFSILELKNYTLNSFCKLANKKAKEYFPDFPLLSEQILTEYEGYYCGGTRSGKKIVEGVGWSFFVESRDVGPAEVIHEEEWKAIAHHPDFSIKIELLDSGSHFPKIWLEKIPSKDPKEG